MSFAEFFRGATGNQPYAYQCRLACGDHADPSRPATLSAGTDCASRLISIPTGLGKTAGWERCPNFSWGEFQKFDFL